MEVVLFDVLSWFRYGRSQHDLVSQLEVSAREFMEGSEISSILMKVKTQQNRYQPLFYTSLKERLCIVLFLIASPTDTFDLLVVLNLSQSDVWPYWKIHYIQLISGSLQVLLFSISMK